MSYSRKCGNCNLAMLVEEPPYYDANMKDFFRSFWCVYCDLVYRTDIKAPNTEFRYIPGGRAGAIRDAQQFTSYTVRDGTFSKTVNIPVKKK